MESELQRFYSKANKTFFFKKTEVNIKVGPTRQNWSGISFIHTVLHGLSF